MSKKTTLFELEGTFLAFVEMKHSLPRRMLLDCKGQHHTMKIAKPLRGSIGQELSPGALVRVCGERKFDKESGAPKEKAYLVELLGHSRISAIQAPTGFIQVCTKANCWKNGGKQLWQQLEATLTESGLEGKVQLLESGCLKNCKNRPSCCFQPAGTVLGGDSPERICSAIKTHFGNGELV